MITGQGRRRSLKTVQSAEGGEGRDKRERIIVVVGSPCQEKYPAAAHPSARKSVLESANAAWTRSVHRDAPGQRHGQQPVSGTADPGVVKQDKSSRGSVDTTKTRSDPHRVRMSSGERPIGAAKGKQPNTKALCQPPPTPITHTTAAAQYCGGSSPRNSVSHRYSQPPCFDSRRRSPISATAAHHPSLCPSSSPNVPAGADAHTACPQPHEGPPSRKPWCTKCPPHSLGLVR